MSDFGSGLSDYGSSLYVLREHVSLKPYHTFGLAAKARFFCEIDSEPALQALLKSPTFIKYPHVFLGEGSNTLFTQDFPGIVVRLNIKGVQRLAENKEGIYLKVSAGENWHDFVKYTLENHYYGLENLSLIPGSVGAAPVQNIGAYGVEVKDVISQVDAVDVVSGEKRVFENDECYFAYRDSCFKSDLKGRYIITAVSFRLKKQAQLNLDYAGLNESIKKIGLKTPTPLEVSDVVCSLRQEKLPDPKKIKNAGSFFKNPIISKTHYLNLQKQFPEIKSFKLENQEYKVSAGWLIECCGFKGESIGSVGVYEKQALVLINDGGASGKDVHRAITRITEKVDMTFGIFLEVEPTLL